jgi:hypothetical protein
LYFDHAQKPAFATLKLCTSAQLSDQTLKTPP